MLPLAVPPPRGGRGPVRARHRARDDARAVELVREAGVEEAERGPEAHVPVARRAEVLPLAQGCGPGRGGRVVHALFVREEDGAPCGGDGEAWWIVVLDEACGAASG